MKHASMRSSIVQGGGKRRYRRRIICIAYALSKGAAAVANAAIRRSVPKPLSSVPSMAIDAACVQDEGYWTKPQINRPCCVLCACAARAQYFKNSHKLNSRIQLPSA
jgi:hypothetical protein